MTEQLRKDLSDFELQRISGGELRSRLPFPMENKSKELRKIMDEVIAFKKGEDVAQALTLLWLLEENHEFTDLLHQLILESWHTRYEEIIHSLQERKDPSSVPVIREAIQKKYEYLESYGTGTAQFISQCGHALKSIGTPEALEVIKDLAEHSNDPLVKAAMRYRWEKINA